LDAGRVRVAEKTASGWLTHQWVKKAVLLSFRLNDSVPIGLAAPNAPFRFYDKVPTKFARFDDGAFGAASPIGTLSLRRKESSTAFFTH